MKDRGRTKDVSPKSEKVKHFFFFTLFPNCASKRSAPVEIKGGGTVKL